MRRLYLNIHVLRFTLIRLNQNLKLLMWITHNGRGLDSLLALVVYPVGRSVFSSLYFITGNLRGRNQMTLSGECLLYTSAVKGRWSKQRRRRRRLGEMRGTEERRETGGPTLPPSETISLDHLVRLKFPALPPSTPLWQIPSLFIVRNPEPVAMSVNKIKATGMPNACQGGQITITVYCQAVEKDFLHSLHNIFTTKTILFAPFIFLH